MGFPQLTEKIILTDEQRQVLDGAMLGDGSLVMHKNGKNAQFTYVSHSKEHVSFVANYFRDYWSGEGLKEYSTFDERTQKEYSGVRMRTYVNETFTEQYHRWYSDIKHLPDDLILTPLVCLVWYIGDGGLCTSNRSQNIKLSTHCFPKEEQERILLPQLQQFEASLMAVDKENGQYYVYIPHRKIKDFLDYIGPCPFQDYAYKWDYLEYKNAMPQNHTSNEEIFCEMYKNGKSYYQIAKEFGIEANAVKYYLIKNNIYVSQNGSKTKNAVIACSLDGEPIQIYPSAVQASKELGVTPTGISNVINGRRKTAGGYTWRKYALMSKEGQKKIQELFSEYFL